MNKTCQLIKELREQNGLSPIQFSKIMGVSKASISKWESDEIPGLDNLYKIARYFRVTVDELLTGQMNTESNLDYFKSLYDLSPFDISSLFEQGNTKELIEYYKKCQNIKNRYLKFLPAIAYKGLSNVDLEEFKYLSRYISLNRNKIIYESDTQALREGRLDPNKIKALHDFFERIKHLNKEEQKWEIEKIISFGPNLHVTEVSNTHSYELFVEVFKLLDQPDKDYLLNNLINRNKPINVLRNKFVLAMLNDGAKVLRTNYYHSEYWDEYAVLEVEGEMKIISKDKTANYNDSKYYQTSGDCSFAEYLEVVDEEKTSLLLQACKQRKNEPQKYYADLKAGKYDLLLDF